MLNIKRIIIVKTAEDVFITLNIACTPRNHKYRYPHLLININSKSWFPCVFNKMMKKVDYYIGSYPMINRVNICFLIFINSS